MTEHELMMTTVLDCNRTDLYLNAVALDEKQSNRINAMKQRRIEGVPLQYVLGSWDFCGHSLKVDERALIPRPETEILVDEAIKRLESIDGEINILNVGVGCGNIEVALGLAFKNARITGVDISHDALALAKQNIEKYELQNRVVLNESSVIDFFSKETCDKYDLIISNPPYIRTEDLSGLPDDVQHEPQLALDGGVDGLDFYRFIINAATRAISKDGLVMFECGDAQHTAIAELFDQTGIFKNSEFIKDYVQVERIVIAQYKGRS